MFRISLLLLPFILVGCSPFSSQISYHKQPNPTVCSSSGKSSSLSMQVIAKDSTLVRIKNKAAKNSKGEGSFDEITLTKSELSKLRNELAKFDSWSETVQAAGVDVTQNKFYKVYNDATFNLEFYSRGNAAKTGLNIRIYRQDVSFTYNATSVSCLLNACDASLNHQEKMDNLPVNLP